VIGLHELDIAWFRAINLGWRSPVADVFFLIVTYWGLGQVQFLASLLFLRSRETKPFVVPLMASVVIVGLAVAQLTKRYVPRERPSNLEFAVTQESHLLSSFVSGHTTTAFSFATMLLLLTWKTKRMDLGWAAMALAVLVGLSRIYRGVHWPSDAIGGMFAGIAGGCIVFAVMSAFRWIKPNIADS